MAPSNFPLWQSWQRWQLPRILVVLVFLVMLWMGAVPGYLQGEWQWKATPPIATLKQLRDVRAKGLSVPGWTTLQHRTVAIGGQQWSAQEIQQPSPSPTPGVAESPAMLLLLTQNGPTDQPQVEWMDIQGVQRWTQDSVRQVKFTVPASDASNTPPIAQVEAQFFRGWTRRQTFAVLQWYAWPGQGHPAPSRWFWADRLAQLSQRRLPWVAVSVLIPIEPLGDIQQAWPLAESLGQKVQAALMAEALQPESV